MEGEGAAVVFVWGERLATSRLASKCPPANSMCISIIARVRPRARAKAMLGVGLGLICIFEYTYIIYVSLNIHI